MTKRLIGIILCMALVFTMFPSAVLAGSQPEVIAEIDQYKLGGESVTIADIPAYVTTYANGTTTSTDGAVIVYIMNHGGKVVGTEGNGSILSSYLTGDNAGKYVIVTVDFLNNPLAVSPTIDVALQTLIRTDIWSSKKFMYGNSFVKETTFVLPEGSRLARDVWYYDLLGNGAKGTKEAIVASWNTDKFKSTHGSKIPPCEGNNFEGGWFEATDISQLVKSKANGGGPIDTNLCLDIVYPSNPKEKTPVFMHSSSWERRYGSESSAFNIGMALRGYTVVTYDHEYYPMARDDHYGYYGGAYGTAQQNGVKTHTAAARCVKYYADTYGYDANRICNMGISKAAYTALLGHPDPESLEELSSYSSYGYTKGDNYGEQPFLKDQKGNDLSGHIQVTFTAMGDGARYHKRLMTKDSSPIVTCCGYHDEFGAWDYWAAQQQTYKDLDLPNLAITMMDLGHNAPLGVDPDLNFLREDAVMDFYDYYINTGSPKLTYMYPVESSKTFDGSKAIKLKFVGEIELNEIKDKVTIKNAKTNEVLDGVWSVCNGNTEFDFTTDEYEPNTDYVVVVPNTIKDEKFARNLEETYELEFTTSDNVSLYPVNDAYAVLGETKITGNEKTVEVSKDKKVGYFEFDLSNSTGIVETCELWLNIENNATQTLKIYALKDVNWSETTLTKDNAPSLNDATLVSTVKVVESGILKIDVSEYMADFD
ncbi:MAG: Ig-like domain-containing protein, partial [Clostridia bacterium]|nr:Ig-like domain-containing protein [Clostridia bacterium]